MKMNSHEVSRAHIDIDAQYVYQADGLPTVDDFQRWAQAALVTDIAATEMVVRIVDVDESQSLNQQFRNQAKPTNVLSFPFEPPAGVAMNYLGDLIICAPIIKQEAIEQGKENQAHWAHMIIHGVLHLQGYDHINDVQAEQMEAREVEILKLLGFPDPYTDHPSG